MALRIRDVLDGLGLELFAKTSGSKGLQLYVPLNTPHTHEHAASFALAVAQVLEKAAPEGASRRPWRRPLRTGKVLIDWSQNSRHKTTICAVLAAGPTAAHGVHAGDLGRGRGRRRRRDARRSRRQRCSHGSTAR